MKAITKLKQALTGSSRASEKPTLHSYPEPKSEVVTKQDVNAALSAIRLYEATGNAGRAMSRYRLFRTPRA